ncbi:OLC1v1023030C1 [Oldenlandia corymbosa var. corymbosa]|uniref:OLC1v1023030C1 n=1 Tax=Oldenlandia corymbosa var. corymbosa TaxID=529605 RepID=A0AAV1BZJ3_OLDCO|nr:OLC1v1023030C1 [Oldenlandia corymbosa var. corymbosa]
MASKGWFSVGMLFLSIFFHLGSGHRLLKEPHASHLDPPPSPIMHIGENSFATLLASNPALREHVHQLSLAAALSPAASPSNHIHGHNSPSSAPSLSPALSPNLHIPENSLSLSQAVSPLPRKRMQDVHFESTDWLAEGAKTPKRKHQTKPVRKPKHKSRSRRSAHDLTSEPWFFDSWEKKTDSEHDLPHNKPTTDQQHEHLVHKQRVDMIGAMKLNSPYEKVAS